jgi:uncharacterized protein YceK
MSKKTSAIPLLGIIMMAVFFQSGCASKIDAHARNEPFQPVKTYGVRALPAPDFPSVVLLDTATHPHITRAQLFYVKKLTTSKGSGRLAQ